MKQKHVSDSQKAKGPEAIQVLSSFCAARGNRNPLFLIRYTHKNAGRASLAFCLRKGLNTPFRQFRLPRKVRRHLSPGRTYEKTPLRASLCVRPGVIETPTNPWQGLVIPLNHGRIYIYLDNSFEASSIHFMSFRFK